MVTDNRLDAVVEHRGIKWPRMDENLSMAEDAKSYPSKE